MYYLFCRFVKEFLIANIQCDKILRRYSYNASGER